MLRTFSQDSCPPHDQHIGKPSPVVVVSVDDHGNMRVFPDVFDSFQEQREPLFGFFVDRRIKLLAIEGKADGNDVGSAFSISGGQMGHARRAEESLLLFGQPQPDAERPAVRKPQLTAFVGLVAGFAQLVADVLQPQRLVVTGRSRSPCAPM